jgi:hypothetical protein
MSARANTRRPRSPGSAGARRAEAQIEGAADTEQQAVADASRVPLGEKETRAKAQLATKEFANLRESIVPSKRFEERPEVLILWTSPKHQACDLIKSTGETLLRRWKRAN